MVEMMIKTVEARCSERVEEARLIASQFGGDCVTGPLQNGEYRIVLFSDREELWDYTTRKHGFPLSFQSIDRRIGAGNLSKKQPIAKAVGAQANHIVDATAGLGHDACLLACMGWQVDAIERDPFVACLLNLAVADANRVEDLAKTLQAKLRVQCGQAEDFLAQQTQLDVVYLDPMFEMERGSALPRKPAQVLQALVGQQSVEGVTLLQVAKARARRVVVKRPRKGPPLGDAPNLSFKGRQVRYDVYLSSGDAPRTP